MNERDFAVVVGISKYGSIRPELEGPERDAAAFANWLESPDGGDVPSRNVTRILSSSFEPDNLALGQNVENYQPTLSAITAAFFPLMRRAVQNPNVPRVGRRLYIYLSGHGMTPRVDPVSSTNNAALLAANCIEDVNYESISGYAYAEWFRLSHAFEEILLFMDCCRNDKPDVPSAIITTPIVRGGRPDDVQVFYAWATLWDTRAWEQPLGNPPARRGVFTYALLEALNEGPPDEQGRLTPRGVVGHLAVRIPELRQGDVRQVPQFFPTIPDGRIVIVPRVKNAPQTNVKITFGVAVHGQEADLQDGAFTSVQTHTATADPWFLALSPGTYTIRVGTNDTAFAVRPGAHEVEQHVDA